MEGKRKSEMDKQEREREEGWSNKGKRSGG